MATVGRNQPCPCGSGKRYKECHGAIDAPSAASSPAAADLSWVPQVMHAALRAQRRGRGREAAEGYRRVLGVQPRNFDATHMLALVEYEQGHTDDALAMLRRAIELRPDIALARHNLRILESMPLIEDEIGREVLPRLLPRIQPLTDVAGFASPGSAVHIVIADELDDTLRGLLDRLSGAFAGGRFALWVQRGVQSGIQAARRIDVGSKQHPEGGSVFLFGAARSPLAWLAAGLPEKLALVLTRDDPCAAIDRIDEMSGFGTGLPGLICATPWLAERLRLPRSAVLTAPEATTAANA
jgi:tetratricopeptide (TPR) repeat protein